MFKFKWTCTSPEGKRVMVVSNQMLTNEEVRAAAKLPISKIERNR